MNVIFAEKSSSRNGTRASFKLLSKENFMNGEYYWKDRHDVMFGTFENWTRPICEMKVEEFEAIFTMKEILEMRKRGILNYDSTERSLYRKYPMFRKDIYMLYGKDVSR